ESVAEREILVELNVVGFKGRRFVLWCVLDKAQRERLADDVETGHRNTAGHLQSNLKMPHRLSAVLTRLEWKREVRFQIIDREHLGVFKFEPLCAVSWNRRDLNSERCVGGVFAFLFQKAGIDRLQREVFVDLFRASLLQDDSGDSNIPVPHRKVRDRRGSRNQKNVTAFLNAIGVIAEDLSNSHASILTIDEHVQAHLVERKNRWIGLLSA